MGSPWPNLSSLYDCVCFGHLGGRCGSVLEIASELGGGWIPQRAQGTQGALLVSPHLSTYTAE